MIIDMTLQHRKIVQHKIEVYNLYLNFRTDCDKILAEMLQNNNLETEALAVSYTKLWKLLIDKNMSKTQLIKDAKISTNAMAKLGKNEDVRVEVLVKICNALECNIEDIMELTKE